MRAALRPALIPVAVVAVLLTACGSSGSGDVVRPPTGPASTTSPAGTSGPPPSSSPAPASSTAQGGQTLTVTPDRGLAARQVVKLRATGFTPGGALQVIQCADKGQLTGPGDCNLTGMLATTADANGRVDAQLTVVRGPFGANNIVCSATQKCLVSVTQASLSPTEEADAPISFRPAG